MPTYESRDIAALDNETTRIKNEGVLQTGGAWAVTVVFRDGGVFVRIDGTRSAEMVVSSMKVTGSEITLSTS